MVESASSLVYTTITVDTLFSQPRQEVQSGALASLLWPLPDEECGPERCSSSKIQIGRLNDNPFASERKGQYFCYLQSGLSWAHQDC